jgi:hypothetical protein
MCLLVANMCGMKMKFVATVIGLGLAVIGAGVARAEECRGLWVDAFGRFF